MIPLSRAVVVEGKYDRAKLASVIDAPILQTDGFGIFRDKECRALIRRYALTCGLIVLTDSDSAGRVIRSHIRSIAGEGADIVHLYIPKISGKEKRKHRASREGLIGVEGMENGVLEALFETYRSAQQNEKEPLKRTELYEWRLFGTPGSAERRRAVLTALGLPEELSVSALLEAINFLFGKAEFERIAAAALQCEKNE